MLRAYLITQHDTDLDSTVTSSVLQHATRPAQLTVGYAAPITESNVVAGLQQPGSSSTGRPQGGNLSRHAATRTRSRSCRPAPELGQRQQPGDLHGPRAVRPGHLAGHRADSDPVTAPTGRRTAETVILVVAVDLGNINALTTRLVLFDLVVGGAIVIVLATVGVGVVRANLRPLNDIELTAGQIAQGHLDHRVPEGDPRTEIGSLSRSLNAMLTQIERAFHAQEESEQAAHESEERMRRFIADASHELRTPLTTIRGFAAHYRHARRRGRRPRAAPERRDGRLEIEQSSRTDAPGSTPVLETAADSSGRASTDRRAAGGLAPPTGMPPEELDHLIGPGRGRGDPDGAARRGPAHAGPARPAAAAQHRPGRRAHAGGRRRAGRADRLPRPADRPDRRARDRVPGGRGRAAAAAGAREPGEQRDHAHPGRDAGPGEDRPGTLPPRADGRPGGRPAGGTVGAAAAARRAADAADARDAGARGGARRRGRRAGDAAPSRRSGSSSGSTGPTRRRTGRPAAPGSGWRSWPGWSTRTAARSRSAPPRARAPTSRCGCPSPPTPWRVRRPRHGGRPPRLARRPCEVGLGGNAAK